MPPPQTLTMRWLPSTASLTQSLYFPLVYTRGELVSWDPVTSTAENRNIVDFEEKCHSRRINEFPLYHIHPPETKAFALNVHLFVARKKPSSQSIKGLHSIA